MIERRNGRPGRQGSRRVPFLGFIGYYALVTAVAAALITWVPPVREAFVSQMVLPTSTEPGFLGLPTSELAQGASLASHPVRRMFTTALILLGALALVLPVAWVYMFTRRLLYDPSLVHSIIILPLAVAAVVVVVKNSLALAFSLAGIVAAVRFRNTLKDPKDAVYIFLAIGVGLAAGVQALDVALVMSLAFGLVVLVLWKYNPGAIYTGGSRKRILSIGDPTCLVAREPEARTRIRGRLEEASEGMKTDGILLVHAWDPVTARRGVEVSLGAVAREWRFVGTEEREDGPSTLEVLVRLKKKGDPLKLLGHLEERWAREVAAAEYIPFKTGT